MRNCRKCKHYLEPHDLCDKYGIEPGMVCRREDNCMGYDDKEHSDMQEQINKLQEDITKIERNIDVLLTSVKTMYNLVGGSDINEY